jgi:hypothetical protein
MFWHRVPPVSPYRARVDFGVDNTLEAWRVAENVVRFQVTQPVWINNVAYTIEGNVEPERTPSTVLVIVRRVDGKQVTSPKALPKAEELVGETADYLAGLLFDDPTYKVAQAEARVAVKQMVDTCVDHLAREIERLNNSVKHLDLIHCANSGQNAASVTTGPAYYEKQLAHFEGVLHTLDNVLDPFVGVYCPNGRSYPWKQEFITARLRELGAL